MIPWLSWIDVHHDSECRHQMFPLSPPVRGIPTRLQINIDGGVWRLGLTNRKTMFIGCILGFLVPMPAVTGQAEARHRQWERGSNLLVTLGCCFIQGKAKPRPNGTSLLTWLRDAVVSRAAKQHDTYSSLGCPEGMAAVALRGYPRLRRVERRCGAGSEARKKHAPGDELSIPSLFMSPRALMY